MGSTFKGPGLVTADQLAGLRDIDDETWSGLSDDARDAIEASREARQERCVCGLTRRQHDEGWPACKGFRPAGSL